MRSCYVLKNNLNMEEFSWDLFKNKCVKDVVIHDNMIQIFYEDNLFIISISKEDLRELSDMDICKLPPEGCCFEHSGCGNTECLQHYPLQEITFELNTHMLINKKIIGFEDDNFVLENGMHVPFIINNNLTSYNVRVDFYPGG
jgi:hypothetical protein